MINTELALQRRAELVDAALDASGLPTAAPQILTAPGAINGAGLCAVPLARQRSVFGPYPIPASVPEVGVGAEARAAVVVNARAAVKHGVTARETVNNYMHQTSVGATGGGASGPPRRRGPA